MHDQTKCEKFGGISMQVKRYITLALVGALSLSGVLASCGDKKKEVSPTESLPTLATTSPKAPSDPEGGQGTSQGATTQAGEESQASVAETQVEATKPEKKIEVKTLTLPSSLGQTLNPQLARSQADLIPQPSDLLYSNLIEAYYDTQAQALAFRPDLAADLPTSNNDGSVWYFKIKEGKTWSNGEPITPETFVESWKILLDPKNKQAAANIFFNEIMTVKNAKAYWIGSAEDNAPMLEQMQKQLTQLDEEIAKIQGDEKDDKKEEKIEALNEQKKGVNAAIGKINKDIASVGRKVAWEEVGIKILQDGTLELDFEKPVDKHDLYQCFIGGQATVPLEYKTYQEIAAKAAAQAEAANQEGAKEESDEPAALGVYADLNNPKNIPTSGPYRIVKLDEKALVLRKTKNAPKEYTVDQITYALPVLSQTEGTENLQGADKQATEKQAQGKQDKKATSNQAENKQASFDESLKNAFDLRVDPQGQEKTDNKYISKTNKIFYLYFNGRRSQEKPFLVDPNFRKAIYYGVDRGKIAAQIPGGATPWSYFLPSAQIASTNQGKLFFDLPVGQNLQKTYQVDPSKDQASSFFTKATEQYQQGLSLDLVYFGAIEVQKTVAGLLKEELEGKFGADKLKVNLVEKKTMEEYIKTLQDGQFDLALEAITSSLMNSAHLLGSFLSQSQYNKDGFQNQEFDQAYQAQNQAYVGGQVDQEINELAKMLTLLQENLPRIPLYETKGVSLVVSDKVKAVAPSWMPVVGYAWLQAEIQPEEVPESAWLAEDATGQAPEAESPAPAPAEESTSAASGATEQATEQSAAEQTAAGQSTTAP